MKTLATFENIIKFCTFTGMITIQYSMIKSDIRELNTEKKYEIEHLQYQIDELKDCCNDKGKDAKYVSMLKHEAILPNGIEIECDNK